jgi:hypothetical protein
MVGIVQSRVVSKYTFVTIARLNQRGAVRSNFGIMMGLEATPASVRLNEIVDALEMQSDESSSFLDLYTGQVETVSDALLREAAESGDEEPDLPAWQKHEWEIAKRIVSTDRFQKPPTKFEVHEWAIMQDFSRLMESESIREDLLHAIHSPGHSGMSRPPFGGMASNQPGFAFRTEALRQIALSWCEENQIVWE